MQHSASAVLRDNYTCIPNTLMRYWLQALGGSSEYALLMWIVQDTLGWQAKDGCGRRSETRPTAFRTIAEKSGLGRHAAERASVVLERMGLIGRIGGQGMIPTFTINIEMLLNPPVQIDELVSIVDKLRRDVRSPKGDKLGPTLVQAPIPNWDKLGSAYKEEKKSYKKNGKTTTSSPQNQNRRNSQKESGDADGSTHSDSEFRFSEATCSDERARAFVSDFASDSCASTHGDNEHIRGVSEKLTALQRSEGRRTSHLQTSVSVRSNCIETNELRDAAEFEAMERKFAVALSCGLVSILNGRVTVEPTSAPALNGVVRHRIKAGVTQAGYTLAHFTFLFPWSSLCRAENPVGLMISYAEKFAQYAAGMRWPDCLICSDSGVVQQTGSPWNNRAPCKCARGEEKRCTEFKLFAAWESSLKAGIPFCTNCGNSGLTDTVRSVEFEPIRQTSSCPDCEIGRSRLREENRLCLEQRQKKLERAKELAAQHICPNCEGSPHAGWCTTCCGTGQYWTREEWPDEKKCWVCYGTGKASSGPGNFCGECSGCGIAQPPRLRPSFAAELAELRRAIGA